MKNPVHQSRSCITLILISLFFLIEISNIHAATYYWVKSDEHVGSWHVSANWSASSGGPGGAGVPGSNDHAIFNGNGLGPCRITSIVDLKSVTINAGYTAGIFQENTASHILLSEDWVQRDGRLVLSGAFFSVGGSLSLYNNAIITHKDNTDTNQYHADINVGGSIWLYNSSAIIADELGYNSGYGSGAPTAGSNDGGAHGGVGGDAGLDGTTSSTYGSIHVPIELGSGGDNKSGGGALYIVAGNSVNLLDSSSITANGKGGTGGAGAGGSIYVNARSFESEDKCLISANGGSSNDAGGGAGGRVSITVTDLDFGSLFNAPVTAYGGTGGNASEDGAAGTVYLQDAGETLPEGQLIIDNNGNDVNDGVYTTIPTNAFEDSWNVHQLTLNNSAFLEIPAGTTLDLSDAVNSDNSANTIFWEGRFRLNDGALAINNWTLVPTRSRSITGNITVENSGTITHPDNSTAETYTLDLNITGDLSLTGSGKISADSLGYDADLGPGAPTSPRDGAAHGGIGGDNNNDGVSSTTYGDLGVDINTNTMQIGSGGAATSGGGAIFLTISGTLSLEGTTSISADGQHGDGGSGSGGSVRIEAGSLSGTGTISANGGTSDDNKGGGGGGRVAIFLTNSTDLFSDINVTISAHGGLGGNNDSEDGAAGTVYFESNAHNPTEGIVVINNNGNDVSEGIYTSIPSGDTWNIHKLSLGKLAILEIPTGTTLNLDNDVTSDDNRNTIFWEGTLSLLHPTLIMDDWTLVPIGSKTMNGHITMLNSSRITHKDNSTAETYTLDLTVAGHLYLADQSTITAEGLGYDANNGLGAPTSPRDGGAHGGIGGDNLNDGVTSNTYGELRGSSMQIGSGGAGQSGGGAIFLSVNNHLTVDTNARINANGNGGNGGSGSGGSIFIQTRNISGAGTISADGGISNNSKGGGGGGRVAIQLTGSNADFSNLTGTISALGGTSNGTQSGAAGTVYLQEGTNLDGDGEGELIIDNGNNGVADGVYTSIPSSKKWDVFELTLANQGILNIPEGTTLNLLSDNVTSYNDLSGQPANKIRWEGTLTMNNILTINNWTLVTASFVSAITGDFIVTTDGVITHEDNSTAEIKKMILQLDGDLTLNDNGLITAEGLGYDADFGLGAPAEGSGDGGAFGGNGGDNNNDGTTSATYAYDLINNTTMGSGGDDLSGGGSLMLLISGDLTLEDNSRIIADGESGSGGAGSGGSVTVSAESISAMSATTISANGGSSTDGNGGGGGGHIIISLDENGSRFTDVLGTVSAYGGIGGTMESGAAGTIYLEEGGQPAGMGKLIVDNNSNEVNEDVVHTTMPADTTWTTSNLELKNNAIVTISDRATLELYEDGITSNNSNNKVYWEGDMIVNMATMIINNWTLIPVGAKTIDGDLNVQNSGVITHKDNSTTAETTYILDLTITGDLNLSGDGTITADSLGYDAQNGPGTTTIAGDGGSHGGLGGDNHKNGISSSIYGDFYGNAMQPGSGGTGTSGGGMIRLNVTNDLIINDMSLISADGQGGESGCGSGGGIHITTGSISGTGTISANGGSSDNNRAGGGGGRVAIYLTNTGEDFSNITGTISAYGGTGGVSEDGAAGTVYLEKEADIDDQGTLKIDNNGRDVYHDNVYTPLTENTTLDKLILNNGMLRLNGHELIIANSSPNAVLSTGGYVVSENTDESSILTWEIDESIGSYDFPFAAYDGTDLTFTFDIQSAGTNSGSTGYLSLSTYRTNNVNNEPYATDVTNMDDSKGLDNSLNAIDRFWNIDLYNYSFNPTADIIFTFDEKDLIGNTLANEDLIAQRFDVDDDKWKMPGSSVDTENNTVTVIGVNEFSPWTLGNENDPLPITLISFEGQVKNNEVELLWKTASEINNDYFTIERSFNNEDFVEIARISGAGNSHQVLTYAHFDETPLSGINYYKLKQTDYDGTFAYSDIIQVNVAEGDIKELNLYPNPLTDDKLYLEIDLDLRSEATVEIFDIQGNLLMTQQMDMTFDNYVTIDPHFRNGIYILNLKYQNSVYKKRFIVRGR